MHTTMQRLLPSAGNPRFSAVNGVFGRDSEPRTVRHFRVRGDMEQDIWYDDNDVPVKFIYSMGEDRVTFTLL